MAVLLGASTAIELLQPMVGRSYSSVDWNRNSAGIFLGFLFHLLGNKAYGFRITRCPILIAVAIVVCWPLPRYTYEFVHAHHAFPVLYDAKSHMDYKRLGGNINVQAHLNEAKPGTGLEFIPNLTSGFFIHEMPGDWRGYKNLIIQLFNSDIQRVTLECRIHDKHHSHHYTDRFNKVSDILTGSNILVFSIKDIINAPKTRHMDMGNIEQISCFTWMLTTPKKLYLQHIRLQ